MGSKRLTKIKQTNQVEIMINDDFKLHLIAAFDQGIRFDGRGLSEFREVTVEYDVSKNAEGSARVKIGNTEVVAGIKMMVDKPFSDKPDAGVIMVNSEFLPMASIDFENGPPGIESIELARVVDRGIRESKAIDLKKLCIKKGEKVWLISIDVCILNHDGNLLDAAALASLAALRTAKFPEYDGEEVNYKVHTDKKIPLKKAPIPVTVYKIGKFLFVDPTAEEAANIDARLTITSIEEGQICALQKGGAMPLTADDVSKMADLALKISKELRKKL